MTGCAAEPDYEAETAASLQHHVVAITTESANGNIDGALVELGELTTAADDALAAGTITQERHESVTRAIALVQTDLEAAKKAAEDAAAAKAAAEKEAADKAAADKAAADAAAQQAADDAADNDDDEKKEKDKGKGNGKGKKDD
jgi:membrane protein involved in colicin uptake